MPRLESLAEYSARFPSRPMRAMWVGLPVRTEFSAPYWRGCDKRGGGTGSPAQAESLPHERRHAIMRGSVAFLLDVDNTLLNNDQVASDLRAHLEIGREHV